MSDKEQSEADGRDKLRQAIPKGFGAGETSPPPPESLPSDANYESPSSYGSGNQGSVSDPFIAEYQEYTVTLPPPPEDDPDEEDNKVTEQVKFEHPWKVTANGNDTVAVAAGCIMGMYSAREDASGGAPSTQAKFFSPFVGIYKKFTGASIQITAATGYVYAKCDFNSTVEGYEFGSNLEIGGNLYYPNTTPSLVFSDLGPGDFDPSSEDSPVGDMYFPIAEVSLTDNVAKVDFQVLTHNPVIQLDDIEHTFTP
jgi:hypothetical protein